MASTTNAADDQTVTGPPEIPADHVQVYINNLPWSTTNEELSAFIEKAIGERPLHANIAYSKFKNPRSEPRSRGFGFATVPRTKLSAVLAVSGTTIGERDVTIVEARSREEADAIKEQRRAERQSERAPRADAKPRAERAQVTTAKVDATPAARPARTKVPGATQLWISNLAYATSQDDLEREVTEVIGTKPIETVVVLRKSGSLEGQSKGFGFVIVKDEVADKVRTLDGKELGGRPVKVEDDAAFARAKKSKFRGRRERDRKKGDGGAAGVNGGTATGFDEEQEADPRRRR